MRNAKDFIYTYHKEEKTRAERWAELAEQNKEARLEAVRIAHEKAIKTVEIFCNDRMENLLTERVESGVENPLSFQLPCHFITDELGNKHIQWVIEDKEHSAPKEKNQKRRFSKIFYYAVSDPLDYKTFQKFMRQHGFSVVKAREKHRYENYYFGMIESEIISISPLDNEA